MRATTYNSLRLLNTAEPVTPATKMLTSLSSLHTHPDHFYLTGFECICVEASHSTISESVVSSVVPFDGELLVIGNSETCTHWRNVCHEMDIMVSTIDSNDESLSTVLEAILSTNTHITHIICSSEHSLYTINEIGAMAHKRHCSFIVDNINDAISIDSVNECHIDYLITTDHNTQNNISLIIARRSKLVQAEGNARSSETDIYALWQQMVGVRRSTLEPMA